MRDLRGDVTKRAMGIESDKERNRGMARERVERRGGRHREREKYKERYR